MKVLKVIKSFLLGLLGVVYFAFALFMTILLLNFNDYGVTQFGDTSWIIINDKVANEQYKKGDLVFVESVNIEDYKVGETVFAYRMDSKRVPYLSLGSVGQVYAQEGALSFENGDIFTAEFVAGRPTKIQHNVGNYLAVIESRWGFLFIILVPCFLIFIYELYALIVEIKYGAEESKEK